MQNQPEIVITQKELNDIAIRLNMIASYLRVIGFNERRMLKKALEDQESALLEIVARLTPTS